MKIIHNYLNIYWKLNYQTYNIHLLIVIADQHIPFTNDYCPLDVYYQDHDVWSIPQRLHDSYVQ